MNENALEGFGKLRVSKLNGLAILLALLTILFLIASLIIAFTPLRNYLPGYMNSEVRRQIVDNALRLDSLQNLVDRQNLYILNIQDIFSGEVRVDTIQSLDSLTTMREDSLLERTQREEEFRRQYEEAEKYNLTSITVQPVAEDLIFFKPTRGMISNRFDPDNRHYGTNIAANTNESVLAALAGTVIAIDYQFDTGNVISIAHYMYFFF